MTDSTEKTGNVIRHFETKGDWITRTINENCVDHDVGAVGTVDGIKEVKAVKAVKAKGNKPAVEAVAAVKGVPAVRGKRGKDELNVEAIKTLAAENHLTVKDYPNVGMYRMNIGNMLRAAARKRHGLYINGKWTAAPKDFKVNDKATENHEGHKIVNENKAA